MLAGADRREGLHCGAEPGAMEQQRGLDALVRSNAATASELAQLEGPWRSSMPGSPDGRATVCWRTGLSSAPPRTLRVNVNATVGELLRVLLRENPALQRRGALRVADSALAVLSDEASLAELGVLPGGTFPVVLVPDEAAAASDVVTARRAAAECRARNSNGSDGLLAPPPAAAKSGGGAFTLLYRLGRTGRAAPRAITAGPRATVIDVIEEVAEREPSVAIRLAADPGSVSLTDEDGRELAHECTLAQLSFRPGSSFPVWIS